MKRVVFDNWILMAIATSRALRIRALDELSLLISGEDFLGAAFATHPPARRSRPIDACVCALKTDSSHHSPSRSTLPPNAIIYFSTLTTHKTNETRDAMILTKLLKAQNKGYTRVEPTHEYISRHTPLKFALHSGF